MLSSESKKLHHQFNSGNWTPGLFEHINNTDIDSLDARSLIRYLDIHFYLNEFCLKNWKRSAKRAVQLNTQRQTLYFKLTYLLATPALIKDVCMEHRTHLLEELRNSLKVARFQPIASCILPGCLGTRLSHYPGLLRHELQLAPTCRFNNAIADVLSRRAQALDALTTTFEQALRNLEYTIGESAVSGKPIQIAVVGNSPSLLQANRGNEIDAADLVIRFNHVKPEVNSNHTGRKTNIWVMSPSTSINLCPPDAKAIMVSGLHPLTRPSLYWPTLATTNKPLCSFPASIWYELVQRFNAPPTAGTLVLATLRSMNMNLAIQCYGFSTSYTVLCGHKNHMSDNTPRSSRHNWLAEVKWLADCIGQSEGFTVACQ